MLAYGGKSKFLTELLLMSMVEELGKRHQTTPAELTLDLVLHDYEDMYIFYNNGLTNFNLITIFFPVNLITMYSCLSSF
jgi:hypothetical protein